MKRIAIFDFDGTITTKDTLFDFIIYSFGWQGFIKCIFVNTFNLALYALRIRSNEKAKEILLASVLKGLEEENFETICKNYSLKRVPEILRKETLAIIEAHKKRNDELIIVSASVEDWIKPWALTYGFSMVLSTKLERKHGMLTGHLASKNCYGKEKVNRINTELTNRQNIHITAYGDSKGDVPMLEYANAGYYLKRNKWEKYR